jgi:hypothetical protein
VIEKLNQEIDDLALKTVIKKLEEQDINYKDIDTISFNELVNKRKEILKKDVKKVGMTTAITIALTIFSCGI